MYDFLTQIATFLHKLESVWRIFRLLLYDNFRRQTFCIYEYLLIQNIRLIVGFFPLGGAPS